MDAAIRSPNSQIARVQHAAGKQLPRRLGVLVVTLAADVASEADLAHLLAVLLHVDQHALGLVGLDNAGGQAGDETVSLAGHLGVLFVRREVIPRRKDVTSRNGAIGLGKAVHVHGEEV